jgi:hypothetical protein
MSLGLRLPGLLMLLLLLIWDMNPSLLRYSLNRIFKTWECRDILPYGASEAELPVEEDEDDASSMAASGGIFSSTSPSTSSGGEFEMTGYPLGKHERQALKKAVMGTGSVTTFHCL